MQRKWKCAYDSNYVKDIRKRNIEYFYPFFIFLEKSYDIE